MFRKNKRGSYLVEASITLPILIVSICSLILIIRIISTCENITFATSINMIDLMFSNQNKINLITLCNEVENSSEYISDFEVTRFKNLFKDGEIDDLILLDTEADFEVVNAIGIDGKITFRTKLMCRGFTGKTQECNPLDGDEFNKYGKSQDIYIFPKYGERYHVEYCRYIKQSIASDAYVIQMDKEDALRKGYTPCTICQGAAYEQ